MNSDIAKKVCSNCKKLCLFKKCKKVEGFIQGYSEGLANYWCTDKSQLNKPFICGTYIIIYNIGRGPMSEIIRVTDKHLGIPFCELFSRYCGIPHIIYYARLKDTI